jgi:hypothetical protein
MYELAALDLVLEFWQRINDWGFWPCKGHHRLFGYLKRSIQARTAMSLHMDVIRRSTSTIPSPLRQSLTDHVTWVELAQGFSASDWIVSLWTSMMRCRDGMRKDGCHCQQSCNYLHSLRRYGEPSRLCRTMLSASVVYRLVWDQFASHPLADQIIRV